MQPQQQIQAPPHVAQVLAKFSPQPVQVKYKYELPSPRVCAVNLNKDQKASVLLVLVIFFQVWIKYGTMIAYQGAFSFTREGLVEHGFLKSLKESMTGM